MLLKTQKNLALSKKTLSNSIKDLILESGYKKIYYQPSFTKHGCNAMIPRHSVYSTDGPNAILRKINDSNFEKMKELIIHKCSTLTVLVKEIL